MLQVKRELSELFLQLRSEDPELRRQAARMLGETGSPKAVPALVRALEDPHRGCQEAAMGALTAIGGEETIQELAGLVSRGKAYVRNAAIEILELIGRDAPALLMHLFQEGNDSVRMIAAKIFGHLHAVEAIPVVTDLLYDSNPNVRCAALNALGAIGAREALPRIREFLKDPEEWVRFSSIQALGNLRDQASLPALLSLLDDNVAESTCWVAVEALGRIGSVEALPKLFAALPRATPLVQHQIVHHLVRIALQNNEEDAWRVEAFAPYESYFIAALKSPQKEVQDSAVQGLEWIGTAGAVIPLLTFARALHEYAEEDRVNAVRKTLTVIGEPDELIRLLSESDCTGAPDELVLKLAGDVLGKLREFRAVPAIIRHLEAPPEPVRRTMVRALGRIGDPGAGPALINLLEDGNGHVRKEAAFSLGRIGDEEAVLPLFEALDREEFMDVRETILHALVAIGGDRVKEKFREFVFYPDPDVQALAIQGIGLLGDDEACDHLIANLGNENERIRLKVVECLGRIDCDRMMEPLIHSLNDESEQVRLAAVAVLAAHPSTSVVRSLIGSLYDDSHWVAFKSADALGRIGDPVAVETMMALLQTTDDVALKIALGRALKKIGDPRSETILRRMALDPNPDIRALFSGNGE